jgi:hypothetical protein
MNWVLFRKTLSIGIAATSFISGYVYATANRGGPEIALIVMVLVILITVLTAFYVAIDKGPVQREPRVRMTQDEQKNAMLFKHQPMRAQFEVRSAAARQQRGRATIRRV